MSAELDQIVPVLIHGKVDFILVGGMAAILHGSARVTFDIDVVYERSAGNVRRLVGTLKPYSPYLRGVPPGLPFSLDEETVKNGLNFTLTTTLGELDLFGEIAGAGGYHDLLPYSDEVAAFGVTFLCVGLDRLIHMKRAARRPKDLEAIAELRVILEEEQNATREAEGMVRDLGQILKTAIEKQSVVRFVYNGRERIVEPQTYGISTTGNELLRGYQREGGSRSETAARLKLFELAKISKLEVSGERFAGARPEHNPDDSAMVEVFATLPRPKTTS
jgi:hypothetical protein